MRFEKDAGGKWLIQHAGDTLLKLCGHGGFTSWRAVQSETVTSRRLPDGLLEAIYPGVAEPVPFLVELETYPDSDNDRQIFESVMAVFLNKRRVPEVISILLKPKGNLKVKDTWEIRSPSGQVVLSGRWRTIKLWELEAEDLFALNDVGLVPWIPLTHTTSTPAELITRCRDESMTKAAPELQKSMLAITHIMARLNYNDPKILDLLGGAETMIDSPAYAEIEEYLVQKITKQVTQKVTEMVKVQDSREILLRLIDRRFQNCPSDVSDRVNVIRDLELLTNLFDQAITIENIEEFRKILPGN